MSYLQCQILDELIRISGSREKYDLWFCQDNLSLKNGVYILNLNSVLNLSYECNTTYHLGNVRFFVIMISKRISAAKGRGVHEDPLTDH